MNGLIYLTASDLSLAEYAKAGSHAIPNKLKNLQLGFNLSEIRRMWLFYVVVLHRMAGEFFGNVQSLKRICTAIVLRSKRFVSPTDDRRDRTQ